MITKRSILDVAAVLDSSLTNIVKFFIKLIYLLIINIWHPMKLEMAQFLIFLVSVLPLHGAKTQFSNLTRTIVVEMA